MATRIGGYRPSVVETKWQQRWEQSRAFRTRQKPGAPKFYDLVMFPYPSGALHMGHVRNYAIGDVIARYKAMLGHNVLHPMGWDAFGLPAENAAIKHGTHPAEWTDRCMDTMRLQLKRLGLSYDWEREIFTCRSDYYRWTQWMFLLMLRNGLAYKDEAKVNWCNECETVLANEQVKDGVCWRDGSAVEQKYMSQWFFRITDYADRLLADLSLLEGWPANVRTMQAQWIGRSEGTRITFELQDLSDKLEVFTTRPDTLHGLTFMVLAPEHPLVDKLVRDDRIRIQVNQYRAKVTQMTSLERTAHTEKEGVFLGAHAINPLNGEAVPIYIGDFVLMEYGTGAVMAVPAHDQRDFEFAQKHGIPIKPTIKPAGQPDLIGGEMTEAYTGEGVMFNAGSFNGLSNTDGMTAIADYLIQHGVAEKTVEFRLRDWLVSRQRYWGAPIPVVYCETDGIVPVPEKNLPVRLPTDVKFTGQRGSPLATSMTFIETTCPQCGGSARRETDTMDTFVCSSWYFLRFADPHNPAAPFDAAVANNWLPVDQYTGGIEHAVLHLLYARFFTKVLWDHGYVNFPEPFTRLLTQGMVQLAGATMSKSKGNVVAPDEIVDKYGADTARVFTLFAAPPEKTLDWSETGVEGSHRFLKRVWELLSDPQAQQVSPQDEAKLKQKVHQTIQGVTQDLEKFALNTAIAKLMELSNLMKQIGSNQEAAKNLLLMLAPFAPHIVEELWEILGLEGSIHEASWPIFDPELAKAETIIVPIQIGGRKRGTLAVAPEIGREDLLALVKQDEKLSKFITGREIVKVIFVPGRILNIVVK